jgi:DNA polymerase I-like protein with 3'-5' exonuclease and polymerase domains
MMWFKKHHWIRKWQNETLEFARLNKFVEAPLSGRREYFYRKIEPNKALNFKVQTTAADIINGAVKPIHEGLKKLGGHLIMQIHDDLTAHVPDGKVKESIALMRNHMEQTVTLNGHTMKFPVDFKVGKNWGHMEEVKK